MKWGYVLFVIFMIIPALVPGVNGDGTPIIEKHLLSVTHENRQIAMVDVHGDYEVIHLFLSIVSLDPGKNITVLIPVRTSPQAMNIRNRTDWKFDWEQNITQVNRYIDESQGGYERFKRSYEMSTTIFMVSPFVLFGWGVVGYLGMAGVGAGGSGESTYHFESGDTITVYNLTSVSDAKEIYEKYNATLPENVKDTLNKYSSYYLVALNAKMRAPINADKYTILEEKCPQTMEILREYVKSHPSTDIKMVGHYVLNMADSDYLMNTFENESNGNYTLRRYFYDTILAMYGYGDMHGIDISMKLPLYDGKAFYPLGTSPAWNSSGEIRVWFRVPQDKEFEANHDAQMSVRYNGYRYYKWVYDGKLPNYDIEGKEVAAGVGASVSDASVSLGLWLNSHGDPIALFLGFFTAMFLWIGIIYVAIYVWGGKESIKRTKSMFKLALATYFISFLATVVVGLFFLYYLPYNTPEKLGVKRDKKKIRNSLMAIIPLLLVIFFAGIYLLYYVSYYGINSYHESVPPFNAEFLFIVAAYSFLSLLIPFAIVLFTIYLLRREQEKR